MDTISLKKYIYDNQKIEEILAEIGCHHVIYHSSKEYWTCGNYNGDNTSAITVKNNEYINVRNYTRENEFDDNADLITLVQYNKQYSFTDALKFLHKFLGLKYEWKKKPSTKPLDILNIFKTHQESYRLDVKDIHTIEEEVLNDYIPILYIGWFKEGVMPWTAKKFGLLFSYKMRRIVIPMRMWNTGELLGINSRTVIENYKELGIKKFFITPTYPKGLNLYGLYENMESIKKAGYVVVFEAEKSVLKRDSRNDPTGVAVSGHSITDEQVRILLGLNVDIIIAMDKDISLDEVRFLCEKFNTQRRVYYMYDKWGIMGDTDSPADLPNKLYQFMFKYKVRYDQMEHNKYEKSLKKKGAK